VGSGEWTLTEDLGRRWLLSAKVKQDPSEEDGCFLNARNDRFFSLEFFNEDFALHAAT
jgi:hypothetical protein